MADFLQILRNTLADVDGAFRTARQDLEEVVGKANDAVHALSQGRVRLRLDELKKDPDSVVLGLYLVRDAQTKQDVGAFGIPSLGYPIASATAAFFRRRMTLRSTLQRCCRNDPRRQSSPSHFY
jgi:hypothetical protein